MTKLSKELCEICGIEPRYGVYQNFGDLDNNYRLVTNTRKCRLIADTRFHVDDEDLRNLKPIYYPDFEQPKNYKKLQEIFINHDHSITLSKGLCAISNGDNDFVNDMYDTSFGIHGKTFLKAVCNYLTLWIEETTQEQISYGIYSEPKDTSHKLTREECIYPRGYDDLLENIGEIKQAIRAEEWKYE